MYRFSALVVFLTLFFYAQTQLTLSGTYDAYAAVSKKGVSSLPFMVSHSKIGQYDINLLELELKYTQKNWTFHVAPAIGSYMSNNYSAELPLRRFVYESYVQYKWKNSELAYGTFSSPYTQETPRGVDQISATRSLSAEYVPYYVSGLRWTHQWSSKLKSQVFMTNGWQRLFLTGSRPSLGLLFQYQKSKWNFNWSHFYGDLAPKGKVDAMDAMNRWRFFQEFNLAYSKNNWTFQSCVYAGLQKQNGAQQFKKWLQGNVQASYLFDNKLNLNGRAEVFYDPNQVVFSSSTEPFTSFSGGYMLPIGPVLQFGQEFRYFHAKNVDIPVFYSFLRLKF